MSEAAVQAYGRDKHFSAATLERWLALATPDRDALLRVAEQLRLGENHFRDIFELADDIAARQAKTIGAVLTGDSVRSVLRGGRGRNETLKQLKDLLRRQRYPKLAATEDAVTALVKQLPLPPGVRIELPENLEGDTIVVTVRATSAEELRDRTRALAAACLGAEVDEMFTRLEGRA